MKIRSLFWILLAAMVLASGCAGVTETGNPVPQQPEVSNWPSAGTPIEPPTDTGTSGDATSDPSTIEQQLQSYTFYNDRVTVYYPNDWSSQTTSNTRVTLASGNQQVVISATSISINETTENYIARNWDWIDLKKMTRSGYEVYAATAPVPVGTKNSMRYFLRKADVFVDITTVYETTGTPGDGVINSIIID